MRNLYMTVFLGVKHGRKSKNEMKSLGHNYDFIYLFLEDQGLKKEVNQVAEKLKSVIAPFVESSKLMAINVSDQVGYIIAMF